MRYIFAITVLAVGAVLLAQQPKEPQNSEEMAADSASVDQTSADDPRSTDERPDADVAADAEAGGQPTEDDDTGEDKAGEAATYDDMEEAVTGPEIPSWQETLDDILGSGALGLLREGGFFMWPILIMGIIATGVVIERYRSLRMLTTDTSLLRADVADMLRSDRVEEALQTCDAQQGPVPAVLSVGVRRFFVLRQLKYDAARIEEQVVKAMDDYSIHIVAALERHLPILATVSSVAPMLGFLGTVQGMIVAFGDIEARMGEMNVVQAAAGGIRIALLTTCFGLIVGIPAFIAYNYFTSVINSYVLDVEESASELMEAVTLQVSLGEGDIGHDADSSA
jgi:biopolymer transport protein ExbB